MTSSVEVSRENVIDPRSTGETAATDDDAPGT